MVYIDATTKKLLIIASIISVLIVITSIIVSVALSAAPETPQLELKPFGTGKVALYLNPIPLNAEEVVTIQVRLNFDPAKTVPQNITPANFWPRAQAIDRTIDKAGTINLTLAKGLQGEVRPEEPIAFINLDEGVDPRLAYLQFTLNSEESYLTALGHTNYFPLSLAE